MVKRQSPASEVSLDPVAEREFVVSGEFLDRRQQPQEELIMRLERRARALRIVRHRRILAGERSARGFAPGPQEVKRSRFKG